MPGVNEHQPMSNARETVTRWRTNEGKCSRFLEQPYAVLSAGGPEFQSVENTP